MMYDALFIYIAMALAGLLIAMNVTAAIVIKRGRTREAVTNARDSGSNKKL